MGRRRYRTDVGIRFGCIRRIKDTISYNSYVVRKTKKEKVNRLNYGVIFGYVGRTKPMTSLLRHTFKIALPVMKESDEREFLKKLDIISHEKISVCKIEKEVKRKYMSIAHDFLGIWNI